MSRVEVQIMGQGYVLASPEGAEEALKAAAVRVNTAMCGIRDAGKIKARDRIAVLASLNLAFDLEQAQAAAPAAQTVELNNAPALTSPSPQDQDIDAVLRELIARLDQTLQRDGQLL
jgi:cell division protein ZapA